MFQLLAIVTKAAVNIWVQVSAQTFAFHFSLLAYESD
jgi:hypothetical protein